MNLFTYFSRFRKSREIGVNFFRTKNFSFPNFLLVHKKKRLLHFPNNTTYIELFREIILDDEYKLSFLKDENIINIADVGANLGMFSVAARIAFRNANIHAYEPNPNNIPILAKHGNEFNFQIHEEALGFEAGRGELTYITSHDTSARISNKDKGGIIVSDLETLIHRFNSRKIDLLKLDCEGAEFEILRNSKSLQHVRFLTMEYHLPANGSETILEDLFTTIHKSNFKVMYHDPRNTCLGIIVAKNENEIS